MVSRSGTLSYESAVQTAELGQSTIIGIGAGAVQGFFGGWTDLIFQRFIEIWTSLPYLYVIIILAAVFPMNFLSIYKEAPLGTLLTLIVNIFRRRTTWSGLLFIS